MIPSASLRRARVPRQSRLLTVATLLVALGLALGLAGCGGPSQAASPLSVAAVNGHPISVSDYSQMLAFNKAENSQLGTFDWQSPSGRSNAAQAEQSTMDFLTGLELKRELLSANHGENAFAADLNKDRAILTDNIQRVENDPTQRKANAALLATLTDRVQFLLAEDQATEETLIKVLPIQTVHLRDIVVQDKGKAQQLLSQVQKGADFGKLADQTNPNNQTPGGEYGTVWHGQLPQEFKTPLFDSKHPKYSIVPYQGQYIVIEVTNEKSQKLATLKDPQRESTLLRRWLTEYRADTRANHIAIEQSIIIPQAPAR